MSKIMIYIGENQRFDPNEVIRAISSMEGVSEARIGNFIGAVFQCKYTFDNRTTTVRLTKNLNTVTAEGLGVDSLEFAVNFQKIMTTPLHAIDTDYRFE